MSTHSQITLNDVRAESGANVRPEFVDFNGLRRLFSIPRSTAYELIKAGEIRSVSVRKIGKLKGRRLIDCQSVREMLARYALARREHSNDAA